MTSYPDDLRSASSTPPPEDRFDDILRQRLADFEAEPTPNTWPTLSAQLPKARPVGVPWRSQVGSFTAGMVTGALLWWGTSQLIPDPADFAPSPTTTTAAITTPPALPAAPSTGAGRGAGASSPTPPSASSAAEQPVVATAQPGLTVARPTGLPGRSATAPKRLASPSKHVFAVTEHPAYPAEMGGADKHVAEAVEPAKAPLPAITSFVRLSGVETRDSIIRQRARAYMKPANVTPDTLRTARLRVLVAEQTRDLSMLQARLDSVKRFLPEAPTTAPKTSKSGR